MWERSVNPSFTDLLKRVDSKTRVDNSSFGAELHASEYIIGYEFSSDRTDLFNNNRKP